MTRARRLAATALLALVSSCGRESDPGPPTEAGNLVINYFQGGPDAGAMLFTITGGPVETVTAAGGQSLQVAFATTVPGVTKVVVSGPLHTGDILQFRVPDITLSTSYVVRTDQVADNVTFSLIDPSVHQLTVHR